MHKLLGGLFVTALAATCFFTFPRAQTSVTAIREIPVVTTDTASGRSPASVDNSTAHFQINEVTLSQLEKNREHLRDYATAEPTAGGWTIHLRPADQIFSLTGVRDGDRISLVELRSQAENAHEPLLADRFVDILRQIEN